MEYAAQHHIGHHRKARTKKTGGTPSPTGRVRRTNEKDKGCSRSGKGHKTVFAAPSAANGFLKCRFLPKLHQDEPIKDNGMERDFYASLSLLSRHYGLQLTDTKSLGYPYNISLAVWEAERQLKSLVKKWSCLKMVGQQEHIFLVSEERYETGNKLYYIPVIPLYKMLRDKHRKKCSLLLLSVCSYLYHIADVPYYRQQGSYMYWQYEMMEDWIEQGEDEDGSYKTDLEIAKLAGDLIEQKIFNRKTLEAFGNRLGCFPQKDEFEQDCWKIADVAYTLYSDFPDGHIFRNASSIAYEDGYEDQTLEMCKYVSFIASTEGRVYETIEECLNCEFQEYAQIQEPLIEKRFDGSELSDNSLDFECRLFSLIEDLCSLLNNFKT